ncbi:MAG: hypothetical protein PHC73_07235, partial [Immundisolibacter sp.]|nr:hypothetical protein [Immundisolibacter sp.]
MAGPLMPAVAALLSHRARNNVHSLILLLGMTALLALLGQLLGGTAGVLWALLLSGLLLALSPRIAPALLLRLYGGRPIHPAEAPGLVQA